MSLPRDDVGAIALAPLLYIGQMSLGIHHRNSMRGLLSGTRPEQESKDNTLALLAGINYLTQVRVPVDDPAGPSRFFLFPKWLHFYSYLFLYQVASRRVQIRHIIVANVPTKKKHEMPSTFHLTLPRTT